MNRLSPWLRGLSALVALLVAAPPAAAQVALGPGSPLYPPAGRVTVLEGARLRAEGLHTLADALRLVPGLGVLETGAYAGGTATLAADGGSAADVLVRWDGVPLGLGDGPVDLSHLTLDGVDRIEVRRGAAAELAGGGASGVVVDVSTRSKVRRAKAAGDVSVGGDRTSVLRAEAAAAGGPLEISGGGSALGTDGGIVAGERYVRRAAAGTVRLGSRVGGWAQLSGRGSRARYEYPSGDIGLPLLAGEVDRGRAKVLRADLLTLALQAGYTWGRRLSVSGSLGRDRRDARFVWADFDSVNNVPFVELRRTETSRTHATAAARLHITSWLEATLGYDYDRGTVSSVDTVRTDVDPASPDWRVWYWRLRQHWWRAEAWRGEVTARRGRFAFEGGLRRDTWQAWGAASTWRASASWPASAGTTIHLGGRSGFRAPGWVDDLGLGNAIALTVDPSLRLQRSRMLEAGVSQPFLDGRLGVAATLIEQRFTGFAAVVPVAAGPTFATWLLTNVGTARARGFEVALRARPLARFEVEAALTHLPSRALDSPFPPGGRDFILGEALIGRPDNIATVGVSLALGRSGVLDLRLRHVSSRSGLRYTTGPVRDTLPGYTTLELGGTVLAWRAAAIVVRIQNLFDARYGDGTATGQQLRGGYLAPGRRAIVGLRLELR